MRLGIDTYIGIDGGGTSTELALVDGDGTLLARIQGPTSNKAVVGLNQATSVLSSLIADACKMASAELPVTSGWIGLAGSDRPEDQAALSNAIGPLFTQLRITNDAALVLSGTPDGTGIALISGTGSIAYARNEHGVTGRSGGWGHIFGDEGSAYMLAVEALRAVAAAADGRGPETTLTGTLMDYWQAETPQHLISSVYDSAVQKSDIAASAPVIVDASEAGDPVAIGIMERTANALAELVTSLARRVPFSAPPPVAGTGGLLLRSETIRAHVTAQLDPKLVQPSLQLIDDIALSTAHAVRRFTMEGQS